MKLRTLAMSGAIAALIGAGASVQAQSNLDKMRNVQTTGTSYEAQFIDQRGPKA